MRLRRRTHPRVNLLAVQADSREAIRDAVRAYTALRGAPGPYTNTIPAILRDGTPVTVAITLTITPQESTP